MLKSKGLKSKKMLDISNCLMYIYPIVDLVAPGGQSRLQRRVTHTISATRIPTFYARKDIWEFSIINPKKRGRGGGLGKVQHFFLYLSLHDMNLLHVIQS